MRGALRAGVVVVLVSAALVGPVTGSDASDGLVAAVGSVAEFEGATIDLARSWDGDSWGAARACVVLADGVECFRSEDALDAAHPEFAPSRPTGLLASAGASADCSTSLRLYSGASYTGATYLLTVRGVITNLSVSGFDNVTSSYKVGACAAEFWADPSAGGSAYPGSTAANAQSPSMAAGWNNVVSSVLVF